MSGTLIAFIILTAILGGYLIDYQKNKLKWQSKNQQSDTEIDELRMSIKKMTRRIENLEAIAADESHQHHQKSRASARSIEIDDEQSIKEENRRNVAEKANLKGD